MIHLFDLLGTNFFVFLLFFPFQLFSAFNWSALQLTKHTVMFNFPKLFRFNLSVVGLSEPVAVFLWTKTKDIYFCVPSYHMHNWQACVLYSIQKKPINFFKFKVLQLILLLSPCIFNFFLRIEDMST